MTKHYEIWSPKGGVQTPIKLNKIFQVKSHKMVGVRQT